MSALLDRLVDQHGPVRSRSVMPLLVGLAVLTVAVPVVGLDVLAAGLVLATVALVVVVMALGTDRAALLVLALAYLTAPGYKGLAPSPESRVTPTDVLLAAGMALLLPTLARRRLRLPVPYLVGVYLVLLSSGVASLMSTDPVTSLGALALWMMTMVALPAALAWWNPATRVVDVLVWSFVVGQVVNLFVALGQGPGLENRYGGLSTHPNYFGEAGLMGIALLMHQHSRTPARWRWVVWACGAACGATVLMSGSRAATSVVVGLLVLAPFVQRSVVAAYLAVVAAVGTYLLLGRLVESASPGSALYRFAGEGSARGSNASRELGLEEGWRRFLDHPLTGSGMIDLFDIHNNFLEVMVAAGVIGLLGYLLVLWTLARGLFGDHELRRLCYATLAYVGFGATIPSLNDRTIWVAVALAVLTTQARPARAPDPAPEPGPPRRALVPARERPETQLDSQPDPPPSEGDDR